VALFLEKHVYSIPYVLMLAFLLMGSYLLYTTTVTINSIPQLVKVEIQKNRNLVIEQHDETMTHLSQQFQQAEDERHRAEIQRRELETRIMRRLKKNENVR
jgi:hypothetical protein